MSEQLPPRLQRMLDDLPVGHAPVDDLLTEGAGRHRRRRLAVVGAAAAVVAVAGGGFAIVRMVGGGDGPEGGAVAARSGSATSPAAPDQGTVRDVPTNGWHPGDGGDQAMVSGTLRLDRNGCLVLRSTGSKPTRVAWPAGYTALLDTEGRTHLRDSSGAIVASTGDKISAGGGYGTVDRSSHRCLQGNGEVASVQSEVTVTEAAEADPMPDLPEPTGAPDDAAYQKWLQRDPLPDCGEQWLTVDLMLGGGGDLAYAACLRAAAEDGTGGEAVVHYFTVEGDPITDYLRVLPDGSVEIYSDSTLDGFGSGRWDHRTCADLESALDQQSC